MRASSPNPRPNRMAPETAGTAERPSIEKGDVPTQLLDRYLIERDRQGRPERYYRDHKTADPAFRDHGRALSSQHAYPDSVAAMLRIAQHRGWSRIKVSGDEAFRREAWIQARTLGLDVSGYRPTERDRQAAQESRDRPAPGPRSASRDTGPSPETIKRRLEMAAVVVRALVADPAAQTRLMEQAWAKVGPEPDRSRGDTKAPARSRDDRSRQR